MRPSCHATERARGPTHRPSASRRDPEPPPARACPRPAPRRTVSMDRSIARRLAAGGLVIGVLAELVLDGPAFGVNVPIVVLATLAIAWLLRRQDRAPDPLDAWLPITAVVLAAFVAIRG